MKTYKGATLTFPRAGMYQVGVCKLNIPIPSSRWMGTRSDI